MGAVLGVLTLVVGLIMDGSISLFAIVGIVVGIPLALISRRQLRAQDPSHN
jgi:hypothetical protein